jgi:hypothetical protein
MQKNIKEEIEQMELKAELMNSEKEFSEIEKENSPIIYERRGTDQNIQILTTLIENMVDNQKIVNEDLRGNIKDIMSELKEINSRTSQPFGILEGMNTQIRDILARIEDMQKNICSPERRKSCEDAFAKKKELRENIKKYKWGILFSTLAVFTFISSKIPEAVYNFFNHFFTKTP